jgi:nitroreductase
MADSTEDEFQTKLIRATAKIVVAFCCVVVVTVYLAWPSSKAQAKKLLLRDRRSVVKYKAPAPAAAVQRALEAAIHAPNHFLNEPWRFRILGPETVAKIKPLNEGKRELFDGIPGWMMVSVVPTAGDTLWNPKALEDHAATACAVQNFMLSLASEGCASKWMTGAMGIPGTKLMEVAGVDGAKEHYMGIIFFGVPDTAPSLTAAPKRKTGLAEPVLSKLP